MPDLLRIGPFHSMGHCLLWGYFESKCLRAFWASRVGIPLIRINRICGAHARQFSTHFPSPAPSALPFNGYHVTQRDSKGAREKHRKQKEALLRRCRGCRRQVH